MSDSVFEQVGPEQTAKEGNKLWRFLMWGLGAFGVALAVAGCGGGGGGGGSGSGPETVGTAANVTATVPASARQDQVASFALAQQFIAATPMSASLPPAAAAADALPTSGNLISNGGFESGMTGWANWGNASVVSGQASSGTAALSVGPGAGGAGQEVGPVVPGTTYRLTARAKVSVASETAYIGVNFLDASGSPITQNAQLTTSTSYTTVTLDVVAPPRAVKALVYVWKNAGSGFAFVDEFAFEAAGVSTPGPESPVNLLTNGGFENGLASWINWGNTVTSTQAASGSSAAQVGMAAGGFGQQVSGVVPGTTYRLTAQGKVSIPGEIGYLGVMFTDAAGTGLLVQNVVISSTTYTTSQVDVTAPANATKALVFAWKNTGSGFASVDEVRLAQVASGSTAPGVEVPVASPVGSPVFQLPWGGEVSGQFVGSNVLRRYSTAGVQIGATTTLDFPTTFGSATVLEGGGYAAEWLVSAGVPLGSSQQLFTQAFTATAQPIGSPRAIAFSPVGDALGNPAAVPQLAPLTGGGYVVVWALQQSAPNAPNDRGVYTQRFDANGQPVGPVQQATADGAGFLHIIGTTTGGYVVSWGKTTGDVGGARAYGADGAPLAPEQVAGGSWHTGAGPRGSIAPLAGGGAALVWQVQSGPVFVQHITASGVALPAQVASSLGSPGRALVAIAGLPDGGSVAAWFELGGNVYARRFAANGTPVGPQTRINLATTPTNGAEIMVLEDGSFMITWDVGTTRYARTFPANGLLAP